MPFHLKQDKIKHPMFNCNNPDITLNKDNYYLFIKTNCKLITENDIPDFNYESLKENFNEERMNINFSSITVSNKNIF